MKCSLITKLNRQVTEKFPEMKGVNPTIRRGPQPKDGDQRYTLTYTGKADLPGEVTYLAGKSEVASPKFGSQ